MWLLFFGGCSGLGTTAFCFPWHASLLGNAGVEEKSAGERREPEKWNPHLHICKHRRYSAWLEGPDEKSQQSGITPLQSSSWNPPTLFPLLAHTHFGGSDTETYLNFVLLSSPDETHEYLLEWAKFYHPGPRNQLQNSMGKQSGRLHHPERSRPLPHQAGKRLPPDGFQKQTSDSALKRNNNCDDQKI